MTAGGRGGNERGVEGLAGGREEDAVFPTFDSEAEELPTVEVFFLALLCLIDFCRALCIFSPSSPL